MELPKHLVIAWSKLYPELKNRGIFSTSRHADASIRISYSIYPETHIDISLNTFLGQRGTAWDSVGQRGTGWDSVHIISIFTRFVQFVKTLDNWKKLSIRI